MKQGLGWVFAIVIGVVALVSCADRGRDGGDADADDPDDDAAVTFPLCTRYVTCIAATAPVALDQVDAQYGEDGACWTDDDLAEACARGCAEGLAEQHLAFPAEPACVACTADAECTAPGLGRCVEGVCVACTADADCADAVCLPDHPCGADPGIDCLQSMIEAYIGCQAEEGCAATLCAEPYAAAFGPGGPCQGGDVCCGTSPDCGMPPACQDLGEGGPLTSVASCILNSCCGD